MSGRTGEGLTGEGLRLALATAATVALLAAISGFTPWLSPDTGGYLAVPPLPEGWGAQRHPVFGWIVAALPGHGVSVLPAVQVAAFLVATVALHGALREFGASRRAAWSVTLALLGSNLLLIWHNAVHPEFLAAVSMLVALALTVRLAAGRCFWPHALALGLAAGLSYALRPSFLPAVLGLPLLFGLLARLHDEAHVLRRAAILVLAIAAPFLLNSALRWRAVGDFNVVSFGGFQMAGMAGLMLSPEIVARLPEDLRPLGTAILQGRTDAERTGEVLATPANSRGERSFASAALGYYDVYARTYDALLYGRIAALQGNRSWVAWNAELMRFSLATVRAAPGLYAAWVVGGTIRFVGRVVAANGPLMLAALALLPLYPAALWRRRLPVATAADPLDGPVLVLLAAVYTAMAGALAVLTTFPAARYVDTAGLLLPCLPVYGVLTLVQALRWPLRTGSR